MCLRAFLGARAVDFPLEDNAAADHAYKGLCFDEAIRRILRIDCSADNPCVADTDNVLLEIYDLRRAFKRESRTLWIDQGPSQVGLDDISIVICQAADWQIVAALVRRRAAGPE